MSLFMSAMRQELREKGRIDGFGGLSSAAWTKEIAASERPAPVSKPDAGRALLSTEVDRGE